MSNNPELIVVIPAFNEVSLLPVLDSLKDASSESISTQIIVIFNAAENSPEEIKKRNQAAYEEVIQWKSKSSSDFFQIHPELYQELNPKKAGVGLGRKLGMDLAANKFRDSGYNGIIVCLDADCLVEKNYFTEIHHFFKSNPKIQGCNIKFEHRFEEGDGNLQEAIIQYEIHLRYYRMALILCDYPYAFHTVGSCMAVTRDAYIKSKGMNTKKAGEDFYFLQKIFSQYEFGEINSTTVYPLGRLSDRVPFGTGAALSKWKESNTNTILTYQFDAFMELRDFLKKLHQLDSFEEWTEFFDFESKTSIIHKFLIEEGFPSDFINIVANTRNKDQLRPKFYRWFNNFKILKCLNYLRDVKYPQRGILTEAEKMLDELGHNSQLSSLDMLKLFRNLDILPDNKAH
jgi:hypothetical protein